MYGDSILNIKKSKKSFIFFPPMKSITRMSGEHPKNNI